MVVTSPILTPDDRQSAIAKILESCFGNYTVFAAVNAAHSLKLSVSEIGSAALIEAVDNAARASRREHHSEAA